MRLSTVCSVTYRFLGSFELGDTEAFIIPTRNHVSVYLLLAIIWDVEDEWMKEQKDMHGADIYEHRIVPEQQLRTGKCKQDSGKRCCYGNASGNHNIEVETIPFTGCSHVEHLETG